MAGADIQRRVGDRLAGDDPREADHAVRAARVRLRRRFREEPS